MQVTRRCRRSYQNSLCVFAQSADGSVGNTDAKQNAIQMDSIRKIEDCSSEHILEIAYRVIAASDNDGILKECSEMFLFFLAENKMNGAMLMEYDDEQFLEDVVAFSRDCDSINTDSSYGDSGDEDTGELEDALYTLLYELKNFNVSTIVKESMEWKKVSVLMDPVLYSYSLFVQLSLHCRLWLDKVSHILPKGMCHSPCTILAHLMKCCRPKRCTFFHIFCHFAHLLPSTS